jgi:hypothetical protein
MSGQDGFFVANGPFMPLSENEIPAPSNAALIAATLFEMGDLLPFSKSFMVLNPTLARLANSCCVHPIQFLAALSCSGDMAKK